MKRLWLTAFIAPGVLAGQTGASTYRLDVIQRVPVSATHARGFYRTACCPDGTMALTHSGGEVTVVDPQGSVRFRASGLEAFAEVTASTCDAANRLWVAGAGRVRRFDLSGSGEPLLRETFQVNGGANRVLVTGEAFYLLGLARLDDGYVFLRRFRLPDGSPSGTIPLVNWRGERIEELGPTVPQLILNGSLFVAGQVLVYVPANPFQFCRYTQEGKLLDVKRPALAWFENADYAALRTGPPRPLHSLDWARNAVTLPDGRVVVHFTKRLDPAGPPAGVSLLCALDPDLENVQACLEADSLGLLEGVDAQGNLCFSDLGAGSSSLIKARLSSR